MIYIWLVILSLGMIILFIATSNLLESVSNLQKEAIKTNKGSDK